MCVCVCVYTNRYGSEVNGKVTRIFHGLVAFRLIVETSYKFVELLTLFPVAVLRRSMGLLVVVRCAIMTLINVSHCLMDHFHRRNRCKLITRLCCDIINNAKNINAMSTTRKRILKCSLARQRKRHSREKFIFNFSRFKNDDL